MAERTFELGQDKTDNVFGSCRWRDTLLMVAESGFYKFGRMAGVKFRRVKWIWESVAGSEEDAVLAEYGVGQEMATAILDQAPYGPDVKVQAFLDPIVNQLEQSVRKNFHRFSVTAVADGDRPTAFALPGGFIFVAPSLVELCDHDRNEIAFVLAHEMAHVIRRHAINRLLREKAMSLAALATPGRGAFAPWIRKVGFQWMERAHSRAQELEADELGTLLMRAAGFDPAGAIRLLERFRRLDQTDDHLGLGPYLSTHPNVGDRILNVRRLLVAKD